MSIPPRVVKLRLNTSLREHWPARRIVGLARLDNDEPGHPSGQWSVDLRLWEVPPDDGIVMAWLELPSPSTPSELPVDKRFSVFIGPNLIGEAELKSPISPKPQRSDDDFLLDRHAPVRSAACI